MMGFKVVLECTEIDRWNDTMHMIKKGQLECPAGRSMSGAEQFYSLAF